MNNRKHRIILTVVALAISASLVFGQGLPIKSGLDTNLATVDANKNVRVSEGPSTRATYTASSSALVTTAAYNLSIEAGASNGFKLSSFCVGVSNATVVAGVTIAINRRTTASSGGTALTAEGTGADSISKHDPASANFPGLAKRTATLGTIGATLWQGGFTGGEIGAGAADGIGQAIFCKAFGDNGDQLLTVAAGVTNGLSITVTAPGAGGLAFGSISATVIVE